MCWDFFPGRTGIAAGSRQAGASGGERPRANPAVVPGGGRDAAGREHRQSRLSRGKGTQTIPKLRSGGRSAVEGDAVHFAAKACET